MKILQRLGAPCDQVRSRPAWNGPVRWSGAILMVCLLDPTPGALAQSFNFNNGNDSGWTRLDLSAAGLPAATYSFPADGSGGKAYRLQSPAPPIPDAGPARAFSYPANDYTRFVLGVDMITWDTSVDQAFGLLTRASSIGLGSTDGYVMNYNVADGDLQINVVFGEVPGTIAETHLPIAPSGGPFRWVFSGYGENLLGQVFVLPDVENPIGSVVAIDAQQNSGKAGLFIFSRENDVTIPAAMADATFDNYSGSVPPAGSLRATVVLLSPSPRQQVTESLPLIQAAILDRETSVQTNSIQLWVDGVGVSSNSLSITSEVNMPNNSTPFAGATVSYQPASLAGSGTTHTNLLVFGDGTGLRTNQWTFAIAAAVTLQSSPTLSPADFQTDPGAVVDTVARSVTVARSGAQRFYRISGAGPVTISSISINGNNVVLSYQ